MFVHLGRHNIQVYNQSVIELNSYSSLRCVYVSSFVILFVWHETCWNWRYDFMSGVCIYAIIALRGYAKMLGVTMMTQAHIYMFQYDSLSCLANDRHYVLLLACVLTAIDFGWRAVITYYSAWFASIKLAFLLPQASLMLTRHMDTSSNTRATLRQENKEALFNTMIAMLECAWLLFLSTMIHDWVDCIVNVFMFCFCVSRRAP